jgi:ABC-type multidrug transport system permease subunit
VTAYVALLVRTPEVVNNASFVVIFPLTYIANTFVPSQTLPGPLKTFAEWNPISAVTQAAREAFGNTSPQLPPADVWPMQHPALYALIWVAGILAVFIPLAVRKYNRVAGR